MEWLLEFVPDRLSTWCFLAGLDSQTPIQISWLIWVGQGTIRTGLWVVENGVERDRKCFNKWNKVAGGGRGKLELKKTKTKIGRWSS